MWREIHIWGFFAGLGLFLLGMLMLEQGLRGIGSKALKSFLRYRTRSPVRGVITGTIATALLQSSSLVGLIVLAFVGAGMLELRNALGIIFGSNLGTTFTGWIVASIGFKLDLVEFAQPIVALGALGTVFFARDRKPYFFSNIMLGLGLLLLGLGEMKLAVSTLAGNIDVSWFRGHNALVYVVAGALFSAIIQSSSATIMILLTAVNANLIQLEAAAAVVIGADLGTTSTILLGALKGSANKRRVALSHLFFNLGTAVLAFSTLPLLIYFIADVIEVSDPLYSVVAFHSLFNVIGIFLFVPFIDRLRIFLTRLVKDEKLVRCEYIRKVPANVTDAAITAVRKELEQLLITTIDLNLHCFKLNPGDVLVNPRPALEDRRIVYEDNYAGLKRTEGEVLAYTYAVQNNADDEDDIREITELNHAVRNVAYSAKFMKDIRHNLIEFRHSASGHLDQSHQNFQSGIRFIYRKFEELIINRNPELVVDHMIDVRKEIRARYEQLIQDIYSESGKDKVSDEETSNLLNVNRAVYLSSTALLEAIRVLLKVPESQLVPEA